MPNCDACYGEKTEDCPEDCLTSHIRYETNRYKVNIEGFFDYDMMPRVRKVILIGAGHIEDYKIELDVFDISLFKENDE